VPRLVVVVAEGSGSTQKAADPRVVGGGEDNDFKSVSWWWWWCQVHTSGPPGGVAHKRNGTMRVKLTNQFIFPPKELLLLCMYIKPWYIGCHGNFVYITISDEGRISQDRLVSCVVGRQKEMSE
jgi:hypothetical protein